MTDQHESTFHPGQKVLMMLPSEDIKLLAKWQGPYEVNRQLGPTTFEILKPGQSLSTGPSCKPAKEVDP